MLSKLERGLEDFVNRSCERIARDVVQIRSELIEQGATPESATEQAEAYREFAIDAVHEAIVEVRRRAQDPQQRGIGEARH
jgi:hypothetical protein